MEYRHYEVTFRAIGPHGSVREETPHNRVSRGFVEDLQRTGVVPDDALFYVPDLRDPVKSDWIAAGWFCIHKVFFDVGHYFPMSRLTITALKAMSLYPIQVSASIWRILRSIDLICMTTSLWITAEDLQNAYRLRKSRGGYFRLEAVGEPLIHGLEDLTDTRHGWKEKYAFFKIDTSGIGFDFTDLEYHYPGELWKAQSDPASLERLNRFRSLPKAARTWPDCLGVFRGHIQEKMIWAQAKHKMIQARTSIHIEVESSDSESGESIPTSDDEEVISGKAFDPPTSKSELCKRVITVTLLKDSKIHIRRMRNQQAQDVTQVLSNGPRR